MTDLYGMTTISSRARRSCCLAVVWSQHRIDHNGDSGARKKDFEQKESRDWKCRGRASTPPNNKRALLFRENRAFGHRLGHSPVL